MKKYKKKIIIAVICLLFGCIAVGIYQTRFTKMYRMVYSAVDIYSSVMRFDSVHIDYDNPNAIYIGFTMKENYDEVFDKIDALYEKLVDVFLYDSDSPYQEYDLIMDFDSPWGESFTIHVGDKGQYVNLEIRTSDISFRDVVERFPETTELYCAPVMYNSIEEIQGLTDLKKIYFSSQKLSEEEKEYILSLYPNCIIEELR